jgi:hypothetical protein
VHYEKERPIFAILRRLIFYFPLFHEFVLHKKFIRILIFISASAGICRHVALQNYLLMITDGDGHRGKASGDGGGS